MRDRKMQDWKIQDMEYKYMSLTSISTHMSSSHQFFMRVSGVINIKDYVTLAITRAQIVSCSYHGV